jgi:hypothetical protein
MTPGEGSSSRRGEERAAGRRGARAARWGVAAVCAVALLLPGAVEPQERAVLHAMVAFVGVIAWRAKGFDDVAGPWWRAWAVLAAAALVGWLPLPGAVLDAVAPGVVALNGPGWHTLGSWPQRVPGALADLLVTASVGALAMAAFRKVDVRRAERAVAYAALVVMVVGAGHALSGTQRWFGLLDVRPVDGRYWGPLINPNHHGSLLVLGLPFMLARWARGHRLSRHLWLLPVAWIVAFPVITVSMGVAVALLAQVLALLWMRARSTAVRLVGMVASIAGAVAAAWAVVALQPAWWRLSAEPRVAQWADTWGILRAHPLAGLGAGAYGEGYSPFRSISTFATFDHAHSDPLEWVAETGALGVLAVILAWRVGPRPLRGAGGPPWALALIGLLAHSFVDFPLQIPAVRLAGVVCAAGWLVVGASTRGSARPADAAGEEGAAAEASVAASDPALSGRWLRAGVLALHVGAVGWWSAWAVADARATSLLAAPSEAGADALEAWAPWRAEPWVARLALAEGADAVAEVGQRAMDARPEDASLLRVVAGRAASVGADDLAVRALDASLVRDPNDYRAWRLAAILAERSGDGLAAARAAAESFRHWPRERAESGQPLEAAFAMFPVGVWWVDALEDAPAHWSMRLSWLLLREGDVETALLATEQAARLRPEAHEWSATRADALRALGRVDDLAAYIANWRVAQPDSPWLFYSMSVLSEVRPTDDLREATTVAVWMGAHELGIQKRGEACMAACGGPASGEGCWCDAATVGPILGAWRDAKLGRAAACERALRELTREAPWLAGRTSQRGWSCAQGASPR